MKINTSNNSPLRPNMHNGYRRREEKAARADFPTGGERLHRKQPKTISEILQERQQ